MTLFGELYQLPKTVLIPRVEAGQEPARQSTALLRFNQDFLGLESPGLRGGPVVQVAFPTERSFGSDT